MTDGTPIAASPEDRRTARDRRQRARERKERLAAEGRPVPAPTGWQRRVKGTVQEEPAIVARDVTVRFTVRADRRVKGGKRKSDVVALDGVSLVIRQGEAVGFIGRNGAGKTTLIKVLAGTLPPDEGEVVTYGATPTMMGLGVGFNRRLSGRRNIYLGCMAAGMRHRDVEAVFAEIHEFSELGKAIDRPVSTYSAGMYARLAFSIAIQSRPQILLVDEALGVGDEGFREKSQTALESILAEAGTIVLVSHGLGKLKEFCDRIVWLDEGRVVMEGDPAEVVTAYRRFLGIADKDSNEEGDGGLEAEFLRGDDEMDDGTDEF